MLGDLRELCLRIAAGGRNLCSLVCRNAAVVDRLADDLRQLPFADDAESSAASMLPLVGASVRVSV